MLLALLALAMAWSALSVGPVAEQAAPVETAAQAEPDEDGGDLALYRRISERVITGEDYYAAALAEQRAGNYPTRPFVTVRLPTLRDHSRADRPAKARTGWRWVCS